MLSGGLDSAILLYCICKYYPKTTVITATGRNIYSPFDAEKAKDILTFLHNTFPNNNIIKSYEYDLDIKNKVWLEKARDFKNTRFDTVESFSQHLQQVDKLGSVKYETNVYDFINGTTANPPINIHGHQTARSGNDLPEILNTGKDTKMYMPWANKDKKYIAKIYEDENLLDSLFKLTRSCVHPHLLQCNECFWCLERAWGFLAK